MGKNLQLETVFPALLGRRVRSHHQTAATFLCGFDIQAPVCLRPRMSPDIRPTTYGGCPSTVGANRLRESPPPCRVDNPRRHIFQPRQFAQNRQRWPSSHSRLLGSFGLPPNIRGARRASLLYYFPRPQTAAVTVARLLSACAQGGFVLAPSTQQARCAGVRRSQRAAGDVPQPRKPHNRL